MNFFLLIAGLLLALPVANADRCLIATCFECFKIEECSPALDLTGRYICVQGSSLDEVEISGLIYSVAECPAETVNVPERGEREMTHRPPSPGIQKKDGVATRPKEVTASCPRNDLVCPPTPPRIPCPPPQQCPPQVCRCPPAPQRPICPISRCPLCPPPPPLPRCPKPSPCPATVPLRCPPDPTPCPELKPVRCAEPISCPRPPPCPEFKSARCAEPIPCPRPPPCLMCPAPVPCPPKPSPLPCPTIPTLAPPLASCSGTVSPTGGPKCPRENIGDKYTRGLCRLAVLYRRARAKRLVPSGHHGWNVKNPMLYATECRAINTARQSCLK